MFPQDTNQFIIPLSMKSILQHPSYLLTRFMVVA